MRKPYPVLGMFGPASHTTMAQILDGSSHTILMGEVTNETRHNLPFDSAYTINPATVWIRNVSFSLDNELAFSIYPYAVLRYTRVNASPVATMLPVPINHKVRTFMGFSSSHPGGAHFCLADGSVKFVGETIDQTLYQNLSTINGGEVVEGL